MERKEFLEELDNYIKLSNELEDVAKCTGKNLAEKLKEDDMLGFGISTYGDDERMIIDKSLYIKRKLGDKLASAQSSSNKKIFPTVLIGSGLILIGFFAKFYIGLVIGVIVLLSSIVTIKNKNFYKANKAVIEKTGNEYDVLKTKWLKVIEERKGNIDRLYDKMQKMAPNLMQFLREFDVPTGLGDSRTLRTFDKCLRHHNGDFEKAMYNCKEVLKEAVIDQQCFNCGRKDFCNERNYNCTNFVKINNRIRNLSRF